MNFTSKVAHELASVFDPELGIDIVSLGLIYGIDATPLEIGVRMALTSSECPLGTVMVEGARAALRAVFPAHEIRVQLVGDPQWEIGMADGPAHVRMGFERGTKPAARAHQGLV
jgi:metal-sulfur cluster biosynthetic enzyme